MTQHSLYFYNNDTAPRHLPSFPTRRSSDVTAAVSPQLLQDGLNGPGIVAQALGPGSLGELLINTLLVIVGIVALMLPVTWVYMSALRVPGYDQLVLQMHVSLTIVVAGLIV